MQLWTLKSNNISRYSITLVDCRYWKISWEKYHKGLRIFLTAAVSQYLNFSYHYYQHESKENYGFFTAIFSNIWLSKQSLKTNNKQRRDSQAEPPGRPRTGQCLQTVHEKARYSCTDPSASPVGEPPSSRHYISSPNSGDLSSGLPADARTYCALLRPCPGVQPELGGCPANCKVKIIKSKKNDFRIIDWHKLNSNWTFSVYWSYYTDSKW